MSPSALSTRSVSLLTGCLLVQSGLAFAFQLTIAAVFGSGPAGDALLAAWTVPLVLSGVVANAVGFAFVPTHAAVLVEGRPDDERRLLGESLTLVLVTTGLLSGLLAAAADSVVPLLVPGFDAERATLTTGLLRIVVWLVPLQSLAAVLRAHQQGHGRFVLIGIAGLVGAGVTLAYAFLRAAVDGPEAVAYALLFGAAATNLLLAIGARPVLRWTSRRSSATGDFQWMLVPLVLGSVLQSGEAFVDRNLASDMTDGTVARLGYATQFVAAISALGVRGLSSVAFPSFARLAAANDEESLSAAVAAAGRGVIFVFVPLAAGLAMFATPTVRALFERDAFLPADTNVVSALVVAYTGVLVFGAAGDVYAKLLYSWRRSWFLVGLGAAGLLLGTIAKLVSVPRFGVLAIACCSSAVSLGGTAFVASVVARRLGPTAFVGMPIALARASLTTSVALGAARLLVDQGVGTLVAAPCAAVVYFAVNLAAGTPFARGLVDRLRNSTETDAT